MKKQPSESYRRVWDKESFANVDASNVRKGKTATQAVGLLRARTEVADFESSVGVSQLLSGPSAAEENGSGPGFFCKVCDCTMKDSASYMDHINGKKHLRLLGMGKKVERVTVEQVRERIQYLKQAKERDQLQRQALYSVTDAIEAAESDKRKRNREKKERTKQNKRLQREKDSAQFVDNDIAAIMGFGQFGTSKK